VRWRLGDWYVGSGFSRIVTASAMGRGLWAGDGRCETVDT
jgi:hypothetical protein